MVKGIITVFLLFLLSVIPTLAQCKRSDREYDGLLGTPRSVRIETAKIITKEGKRVELNRRQEGLVKYDISGNIIEQLTGGPFFYHLYSYTSKGDRLEKSARTPITTGPPTVDDFGFTSQVYINTSFLRTVFKCDKKGNRVEEALYKRVSGVSIGGAFRSVTHLGTTTYNYDGDGHRTEIALHNPSGSHIKRYRFVYEGSAHPVERIEYKENGAVVGREYYTYELDDVGNWIRRLTTRVDSRGNKALAEPVEVTYQIVTY